MTMRIGTGVDVHAFDTTAVLWVGCVEWPGEPGLAGHSDGDVAAHAVCDALLSAAQLGDLGSVFGVDRPEYRDASGRRLLHEVHALVTQAGWRIEHVSVQIIGVRPRVSTRRDAMQVAMSDALGGVPVSVSGTTTDGLGFTGRGEGVAAIANALLRKA